MSMDNAAPDAAVNVIVADFRLWLERERGLSAASVCCYGKQARQFLSWLPSPVDSSVQQLDSMQVTSFMVAYCRDRNPSSAKATVTAVRALLRYLHATGQVRVALVDAVPAVAGWRLASLPRGLDAAVVTDLLDNCDRDTIVGRRDHAIQLLLARLGLRGAEVADLRVDDVDWRSGEITIRGKRNRLDRLPIPIDVGEAVVVYLTAGRPICERGRCSARAVENIAVTTATMDFLVPQSDEQHRHRRDVLTAAVTDPRARALVDSGRLAEPFWYVESALTTIDPARPFAGRPERGCTPAAAPGILVPDTPVTLRDGGGTRLRDIAWNGILLLLGDGVDVDEMRTAALGAVHTPIRLVRLSEIDTTGVLTATLDAKPGEVWVIRPDAYVAAVTGTLEGLVSALHRITEPVVGVMESVPDPDRVAAEAAR